MDTSCDNLPLGLKKKKNLDALSLDFAYLKMDTESIANLQKALNYLPNLNKLTLFLYKSQINTEDLALFFDGLKGMPLLMTLEINIAG